MMDAVPPSTTTGMMNTAPPSTTGEGPPSSRPLAGIYNEGNQCMASPPDVMNTVPPSTTGVNRNDTPSEMVPPPNVSVPVPFEIVPLHDQSGNVHFESV